MHLILVGGGEIPFVAGNDRCVCVGTCSKFASFLWWVEGVLCFSAIILSQAAFEPKDRQSSGWLGRCESRVKIDSDHVQNAFPRVILREAFEEANCFE